MRLNGLAAFAGGAAGALLASAALWQFSRPRTYEQCMLQEMLGQHAQMPIAFPTQRLREPLDLCLRGAVVLV